jgi:DNA primase large subunit
MAEGEKPEKLVELGERLSRLIPRKIESFPEARRAPGGLVPEFFPPCIQITLNGVGSGLRTSQS